MIQNQFKLMLRKRQLGHSERFSELILGDASVAKFIEILHKLGDAYSLLFDFPSQTIQEILQIVGHVAFNGCPGYSLLILESLKLTGVGLGLVVRVFKIFVNVSDELVIINLTEVASVHVLLQKQIEIRLILRNVVKLLKNPYKLVFRHVSNLCDVEIFEKRFH